MAVYLRVQVVRDGDDRGVGKVADLWTKGFLPYTLPGQFTVTESDPPHGFRLEASGDFVGRGIWTLVQEAGPRSQEARGAASGPGIGLALCQRIVAALGGRIWANPRDGGGAELGFALPIHGGSENLI